MRIISGTHKGKRLVAPKKLPVRPTTDFAKEGLFNILRNRYHFSEIYFLDLFAGTGNISYEIASRGCENITCVDADFGCVRYIKKTAEELQFPIETFKMDVFHFLEKSGQTYDLIFADPPYDIDKDLLELLISKVFQKGLLKPSGVMIIEHPKHVDLSNLHHFIENRKYGSSVFSFFS